MNPTRLCIAGVPRSGKTTLAENAKFNGVACLHTDELIQTHNWSDASAEVATWIARPGPWAIEGVAVPRALRKWLAANPEGMPAEVVMYLKTSRLELTDGQQTMAKGCWTVWQEIEPELVKRGVLVMEL